MTNPIMVVLDDEETWAGDGFVIVLKDSNAYPDGDADYVDDKDIEIIIGIQDLLKAYNKVHGTNY